MQILFINNDGGGFADRIDIAEGTTVAQLFAERLPYGQPPDYLIRVNRQPTTADTVLQADDRVSITPTKIEGANRTSLQLRPCFPFPFVITRLDVHVDSPFPEFSDGDRRPPDHWRAR